MPEASFPRRVIYGEPAGSALLGLLSAINASRILLVTDRGVSELGFFKRIVDELAASGLYIIVYDKVEPEPALSVADEVARLIVGESIDAIVAVGGGSVIDAAKAGLVKAVRPDVRVEDVAPFNPLGLELRKPVLIAVPTTSGTGSDASYGIVLTKHQDGRGVKIAVGSPEVVPFASILDEEATLKLPRKLTVGTAVDALSHSIEALVATTSNPLSDALAYHSAELIFTNLPKVVENPDDREARLKLHVAATMAGMAFTNSGLGLAHAIAHPLGAALRVHHGTIVGLVLPYVVEYNYRSSSARSKYERLRRILEDINGLPAMATLADHIKSLYKTVGQPLRIRDLGVSEGKYKSVVDYVSQEALHDPNISFAPIIPEPDEIRGILERIY
ncbi:MAG: iron-containing alcohol dehydrogenase [Desulfurococcales archaeon]|nr:iron-containing alcohol dehydrogenase [Desulfurococcales archaeon]